jgi:hypothetical protein
MPQPVALEDLPRFAPRPAFNPVLAQPIRPFQAAHLEVGRGEKNSLFQLGLADHRSRKKRRIEHLEGNAGGRDTDAGQLPDLARRTPRRHHAKRLAQVIRNGLKGHWKLV